MIHRMAGRLDRREAEAVSFQHVAVPHETVRRMLRVGAGVEQQLGTNLYAKAEYRYSNYEAGIERHQVLGGVGFRF